jgi:hypothetical protein
MEDSIGCAERLHDPSASAAPAAMQSIAVRKNPVTSDLPRFFSLLYYSVPEDVYPFGTAFVSAIAYSLANYVRALACAPARV